MHDVLGRTAAALEERCDRQPFHTGWELHDLRHGRVVAARADRAVPAASTRKVAILAAALAAASQGRLSLAQRVTIDGRYREQVHTGLLQHLDGPLDVSLRDALALMTVVSDNLATAHVLEIVGLDAVQALCDAAGMTGTVHRHAIIPALAPDHPVEATNQTTPADQARLLRLLLDGATEPATAARIGCEPRDCALALDLLRRQQHRDFLPGNLPWDVVVAHKPGIGWRDVADAGIVYADGRPAFLLAVYIDGLPAEMPDGRPGHVAGREHIATLTRLCWDRHVGRSIPSPRKEHGC